MKAFRALLRSTPFYGAYKSLGHYPDYLYWQLRGRPQRAPHLVKQHTVSEYAGRFGLEILIETGTYYGEMVSAMKSRFERIYSIEFDPELAQRAAGKFARFPHIRILQGDSRQALPEVLKLLSQPALFWLDAGYYGWAGAQGEKQRLAVELEAILSHTVKRHVILLDDARGLNGENGNLTPVQVEKIAQSKCPGCTVSVKYDILRIVPPLESVAAQ